MIRITRCVTFLLVAIFSSACSSELLDQALESAIASDPRNEGIAIDVGKIRGGGIIFDLQEVRDDKSAQEVFRVFLQFSNELNKTEWEPEDVVLAAFGKKKFILLAEHMKVLGEEYGTQNPAYTIRTFPEKLLLEDGTSAYKKRQGGLLSLMQAQMRDFSDFLNKWFVADLVSAREKERGFVEPDKFQDNDAF